MEKTPHTDKRLTIMETAEKLFADHGFDGTSVRDIAQAANVNLAMISYYFGSKEKLLAALFEHRITAMRLQMEHLLEDDTLDPLQKVNRLIDHYAEKMFSSTCFHKIMIREQMALKDSEISDTILKAKRHNHELIGQILSQGQKTGVIKKDVDIPLMMATLVGTSNHFLTTQHYYKQLSGLENMPEEKFQQHLRKKLLQHLKTLFKAILTYEG